MVNIRHAQGITMVESPYGMLSFDHKAVTIVLTEDERQGMMLAAGEHKLKLLNVDDVLSSNYRGVFKELKSSLAYIVSNNPSEITWDNIGKHHETSKRLPSRQR
ncbi:hypothetical protein MYOV003v1_p0010 [Vibrio phage 207E48.1]|nr:hypothetical protein MYOV003v1_p0010 [Vibrio phage 207E48.1]